MVCSHKTGLHKVEGEAGGTIEHTIHHRAQHTVLHMKRGETTIFSFCVFILLWHKLYIRINVHHQGITGYSIILSGDSHVKKMAVIETRFGKYFRHRTFANLRVKV